MTTNESIAKPKADIAAEAVKLEFQDACFRYRIASQQGDNEKAQEAYKRMDLSKCISGNHEYITLGKDKLCNRCGNVDYGNI
jgi:hypothetical protein